MPLQIHDFPENQHRILRRFSHLMFELNLEYQNSKPQYGENGFRERVQKQIEVLIFERHNTSILPNGDVNENEIRALIAQDEAVIESDVAWIYLACASATASMRALEADDRELAWSLQCQAHYYLGMVKITNRGEEVFTKTVLDIGLKENASQGGLARQADSIVMKNKVYEMLRRESPWPSQGKAVLAAEGFLDTTFGKNALKDPEQAITKWIKKMPDRFEIIPSLLKTLGRSNNP